MQQQATSTNIQALPGRGNPPKGRSIAVRILRDNTLYDETRGRVNRELSIGLLTEASNVLYLSGAQRHTIELSVQSKIIKKTYSRMGCNL